MTWICIDAGNISETRAIPHGRKAWSDAPRYPTLRSGANASAKAKNADVIICDTAGRLHNKKNLMEELAKINRVINRELPESSIETLLVLDASTGQNAVNQAKEFMNVTNITGIILTKLDGTAKGGIIISIQKQLGIPVKFVGVGEGIEDLLPFDAEEFADGIIDTEN